MIRAAENLLSPSESNALHKFFSQLDHMPLDALNLSPEWSMYVGNAIHIPEGKSELSKATKDLIALGSQQKHLDPASLHRRDPSLDSTFSSQPAHPSANWPTIVPSGHEFESLANSSRRGHSLEREGFTLEGSSHQGPQGTSSRHSFDASSGFPSSSIQSGSYSTPRTLIPPTPLQIPSQGSSAPLPTNRKRPHDYPFSPADHSGASSSKKPRNVSPATSHNSAPLTQSTPFPFASTSSSHLPNQPSSTSSSSPNILSSSAPHTQSTSHPLNPPPPSSHSQSHSTSHTHQPSSSSSNTQPKQTLLSASQKKANHIQSEQKRRANIRRGYEALCDVVPALREAIRAEEAHCASTGKKRGRGRLLGEDGEKMDGRAGPRSESVVLQKTIEHMSELINSRASLLQRLSDAQNALPPGHPLLPPYNHQIQLQQRQQSRRSGLASHPIIPHANQPTAAQSLLPNVRPWERIWDGGIGLPLNGDIVDQEEEDSDED